MKKLSPRCLGRPTTSNSRSPFRLDALEPRVLLSGGFSLAADISFVSAPNGANPTEVLVDKSGDLFGVTSNRYTGGAGDIYEFPRGGDSITTIATFDGTTGESIQGPLVIDSAGNLYGITTSPSGTGRVIELARGSDAIITIATLAGLQSATLAGIQSSLAIDSAGNLFGVTSGSGAHHRGRIFEIAQGTDSATTIASIPKEYSNAGVTLRVDSTGNIFGSVYAGAQPPFVVIRGGHKITPLEVFAKLYENGPLTLDSNGDIFFSGSNSKNNGVFELPHGSKEIRQIANLGTVTPVGALAIDSNGDLFGATLTGGLQEYGTVFEIPKETGDLITLQTFGGTTGSFPTGVILDSNADIFGTTSEGGTTGNGTFFELSPSNQPPAPASKLDFTAFPDVIISGVPFTPAVAVSVEDADGNVVTTDNSTVTLIIDADGPDSTVGSISRTLTATAVGGVATFPNLVLSNIGGYLFRATDQSTLITPVMAVPSVETEAFSLVPTFESGSVPPAAIAGAQWKAEIPLVISNTGVAFHGRVGITLLADKTTGSDGNEIQIKYFTKFLVIKANGHATVNIPIDALPAAVTSGKYHFLAELTPAQKIGSTNRVRETVAASEETVDVETPTIQPAVLVGSLSPQTIAPGRSAFISISISNNGNTPANGVDLTLSPSSDGMNPIADIVLGTMHSPVSIPPGKSKTFRLRFKPTAALGAESYLPYVSILLDGVTDSVVGDMAFNAISE